MPSYVAFLRAINLGKNRKLPMVDLKACLDAAGFRDVETYIQTGNVFFSTGLRSREKVESHLERTLAGCCGFEVPAIVLTPQELRGVYDDALALPSPLPGEPRRYVTFLKREADPGAAAPLDAWDVEGERLAVRGRAVHWWLGKPTRAAKIGNVRIEKALGPGTTRDLKVVATLAGRWGR